MLGRWPKPVGALDSRGDTSRLVRSRTMIVHGVTPILNVSDMDASFAWFAKLGWKELWRWGDPTGFGAVGSGPCEIYVSRRPRGTREREEHEHLREFRGRDAGQRLLDELVGRRRGCRL